MMPFTSIPLSTCLKDSRSQSALRLVLVEVDPTQARRVVSTNPSRYYEHTDWWVPCQLNGNQEGV